MKGYYTAVIALTVGSMIIMQSAVKYNVALDGERRRMTQLLFRLIIVCALCEWAGVMLDGSDTRLIPLHLLVKATELSLTPCAGLICGRSLSRDWRLEKYAIGVAAVNAMLVISSVFTGLIYRVDAQNFYHHGPIYGFYTAACVGTIGFFFVRGIETFRRYQHSGGILIWLVTLFLVLGIMVQNIDSTIRVTWLAVAMSSIMLYKFYGDIVQQVDGLTELLNRWGYESYLANFRGKGAIFFFDVDRFKEINDTHGHAMGDQCLQSIAESLREIFGPYGRCFRIGGDEFCVVMEERLDKIEALLKALSKDMELRRAEQPVLPRVSVGYVVFDTAQENIGDAVAEADAKMYEIKRQNHALRDEPPDAVR